MTENQQEENAAKKTSVVKFFGGVIEDSPGFLKVRVRLYARLIVWALVWPVATLLVLTPFLSSPEYVTGTITALSLAVCVLYIIGIVRIPYTIDIDKGTRTARIPWLYWYNLLFPLYVRTYRLDELKVYKTVVMGEAPPARWHLSIILPGGKDVTVLHHRKDEIALPLYEKLSALIEPVRKEESETEPEAAK